ncbi:cysteine desulfurase DndA [Blastococcus sp. SYSU D00695]
MTTVTATADRTGDEAAATGSERPVYLDCNATAPVEPAVLAEVMHYLAKEYGNAGSRTHSYGQSAKERVKRAREEVAAVVGAQPDEVIFTSGATESDNLAILGLAAHGERSRRKHIVSTQLEHKAVLEPLGVLRGRGFDVTLLPPAADGRVAAAAVHAALRPDTLLVSVMAANNETGVIQPINEIAAALDGHEAFLHVDAAQAFGKVIQPLQNRRIDLLSISGHKLYAPKGIGALVARRRGFKRAPLEPLMYGGGQERGLRPGTLPVALIAGLGTASRLALQEAERRRARCQEIKERALQALSPLGVSIHGVSDQSLPQTLNFSVPGVDSEAAIVALKDLVAVSNGSACTSQSYEPSHVLLAMGLAEDEVAGALRFSWSHLSEEPDWHAVAQRLRGLQAP